MCVEIAQYMDNIERKYGTKMAISTARIQGTSNRILSQRLISAELETELKEQEAEFDEEVTELQEQIQGVL